LIDKRSNYSRLIPSHSFDLNDFLISQDAVFIKVFILTLFDRVLIESEFKTIMLNSSPVNHLKRIL